MPLRLQFLAGFVLGFALHEITDHSRRLKYGALVDHHNSLVDRYNEVVSVHNALEAQMGYLVSVLNDRGILLDEFDWIVLTNLQQAAT